MKIGKLHRKCDLQDGLVEDMVEAEGDHQDLPDVDTDHIHALLHPGTIQGKETGVHVETTLQQTLSPHHLTVIGNTIGGIGQSNDPLVPRGMAEAHPGHSLTVLVIDGAILAPALAKNNVCSTVFSRDSLMLRSSQQLLVVML